MKISGFAVIEHDNNGTIHGVTMFPSSNKAEAFDYAYALIKETLEEDEDKEDIKDAIDTLAKTGSWFGYSAAITVQKTN